MKINVFNLNGDIEAGNNALAVILKEGIASLEKDNEVRIEDVRIEELNATFTFKMEGSDEYRVASVSHDDFTEMYEVDYNLEEGTLEDNEQLSLFGKEDQEFVSDSLNRLFPAVEKKINDKDLFYQSEEKSLICVFYASTRYTGRSSSCLSRRTGSEVKKSTPERLIQKSTLLKILILQNKYKVAKAGSFPSRRRSSLF